MVVSLLVSGVGIGIKKKKIKYRFDEYETKDNQYFDGSEFHTIDNNYIVNNSSLIKVLIDKNRAILKELGDAYLKHSSSFSEFKWLEKDNPLVQSFTLQYKNKYGTRTRFFSNILYLRKKFCNLYMTCSVSSHVEKKYITYDVFSAFQGSDYITELFYGSGAVNSKAFIRVDMPPHSKLCSMGNEITNEIFFKE